MSADHQARVTCSVPALMSRTLHRWVQDTIAEATRLIHSALPEASCITVVAESSRAGQMRLSLREIGNATGQWVWRNLRDTPVSEQAQEFPVWSILTKVEAVHTAIELHLTSAVHIALSEQHPALLLPWTEQLLTGEPTTIALSPTGSPPARAPDAEAEAENAGPAARVTATPEQLREGDRFRLGDDGAIYTLTASVSPAPLGDPAARALAVAECPWPLILPHASRLPLVSAPRTTAVHCPGCARAYAVTFDAVTTPVPAAQPCPACTRIPPDSAPAIALLPPALSRSRDTT